MHIPLYQVDAFTDRPFAGNPAAVCLLDAWPEDALLQSIATENNLSETAFLVKDGARYQLRWMTPITEVELCGHATLAAAFVIFNHLDPALGEVAFDTLSGELRVRRGDGALHMDFPSLPPVPCVCPPALLAALGKPPQEVLQSPPYYLARYDCADDIRALQPDMEKLKALDLMATIVTAPGDAEDFVSRVFGPKVGIPEDPVTGSAHSVLIPYWAARLGKLHLHARQLSTRGGELFCELRGDRVGIAGQAVLFMQGEIRLDRDGRV
ncbi:MAG: PhzF family phenazine biosynthesis protein [Thiobacillus sp.]|nr:PhzF family phenazine biosynthesis protein [Thiobacillus sp.]